LSTNRRKFLFDGDLRRLRFYVLALRPFVTLLFVTQFVTEFDS
jgi:hypothetical protein